MPKPFRRGLANDLGVFLGSDPLSTPQTGHCSPFCSGQGVTRVRQGWVRGLEVTRAGGHEGQYRGVEGTRTEGLAARTSGLEGRRIGGLAGRLLRLPGLAGLDETAQESPYPHDLRRHPLIIGGRQRSEITREFELRLQLSQGPTGHLQEAQGIQIGAALISFGDVRRHRNRRPAQLVTKAIISAHSRHFAESQHLQRQLLRGLPSQQVPKGRHLWQWAPIFA